MYAPQKPTPQEQLEKSMRELIELEEQKLATMKALLKAYQMQQTAIKRGVL